MGEPACVGAFVRDARHRVLALHRCREVPVLPGVWDIVGGHLEPGETPEQALAREVAEETGWRLRRVESVVADWEWEYAGVVRREVDYLVEVDGDLAAPRLASAEHDGFAWIGLDNVELMMQGRTDGDRRLRDLVAKVARTRFTDRLRLEPIGPEHAHDLWRLHHDEAVAAWHGGRYTAEAAYRRAIRGRQQWEKDGVEGWMAYDRCTGELIGRGGLARTELEGRRLLELGWTVRADLWGRGFATEIGRAALAFAFHELAADLVIALTVPHNWRSRAVMERLRMRYVRQLVRDGSRLALYAVAPPA
jgi:RimJ/RimL family protein N-acetyltransferase